MLSLMPGLICFHGKESGVILAISSDEKCALFAGKDMTPLRWVEIGEITGDPAAIVSGDDIKKLRPR
jgi:hypothetical protein